MKSSMKRTILIVSSMLALVLSSCGEDESQSDSSGVWGASSSSQASSSLELSSSESSSSWSSESSSEASFSSSEESSESVSSSSIEPAVYQIRFENFDGTLLKSCSVLEGETPVYDGDTPTKPGDAQYNYTFSGWQPALSPASSDQTYVAFFSSETKTYSVAWENYDGTVLLTKECEYGETPVYDGSTPTKPGNERCDYVFSHWSSPDEGPVKKDRVYTAEFSETPIEYAITWKDHDGTTLRVDSLHYGDMPSYGDDPSRGGDAQYSYAFSGWVPSVERVSGDATYVAQYEGRLNSYEITWKNEDGTVLSTDVVEYGTVPAYKGEEPTKEGDAQYSYVFSGWDPLPGEVVGSATYTAQFASNVNTYEITWKNYDGTVLDTDEVPYGSVPSYKGETPTREHDASYSYVFSGWDASIAAVTGEATYTACYEKTHSWFTVTFDPNGGSGGPGSQAKEKDVDIEIDFATPTRSGYTFMGWNCLESDDVYQPGDAFSLDEDMTLYAMWCEHCSTCEGKGYWTEEWVNCSKCNGSGERHETCTMCSGCAWYSYFTCSGTCSGKWKVDGLHLVSNCPTCGKKGKYYYCEACGYCEGLGYKRYTCTWCNGTKGSYQKAKSEDLTGKTTREIVCTSCNGSPLIYPKAPTLVSFDHESIEVKPLDGYEYSLDGKTWQKSNVFRGLTNDASYSVYQRVASTEEKPFGVTSDPLTVSTTPLCEIEYDLDGGTQEGNPAKLNDNSKDVKLNAPTKKGYEFVGWTGSNGETPNVDVSIPSGTLGQLNYKANWELIEYSITYDLGGGTNSSSNPSTYTIEDSFELASPTRTGCTFRGWYNGSSDVTRIRKGTTGDMTLSARWNVITYSITYHLNGGKNVSSNPKNYTVESPDIVLSDPTREGYTFEGWYTDSSYSNKVENIPSGSSEDVALWAKWEANKYNLSVTSSDESKGSVSVSGEGCTDEEITVTATPIGDYIFTGWFSGEREVSDDERYTFKMPSHDYSLTASFWAKDDAKRLGITPTVDEENGTVTYGLYPQTHVSDEATIAALNSLTSPQANGWYCLDGEYYAKKAGYIYTTDGSVFNDGTTIVNEATYWFKCEPIKWKILSSSNGQYSLVSTALLGAHRFNKYWEGADSDGYYANNYERSEIRAWLNDDFYNSAFSFDSFLIQTTTVDNSAATTGKTSNSYACRDTSDNVYLLSCQDYLNADYGFDSDGARQCRTTDWARANGACYGERKGRYWTRSPSYFDSYGVCRVIEDGSIRYGGYVNDEKISAIRPAITIKVS